MKGTLEKQALGDILGQRLVSTGNILGTLGQWLVSDGQGEGFEKSTEQGGGLCCALEVMPKH